MPHSVYFAPEAASNLPRGDDFLLSRDTDSEKGKIKRARSFSLGTRSLSSEGENGKCRLWNTGSLMARFCDPECRILVWWILNRTNAGPGLCSGNRTSYSRRSFLTVQKI